MLNSNITIRHAGSLKALFASGAFNRTIGWSMLIIGMGLMALYEPWIFSLTDTWSLEMNEVLQLRHWQGVLLTMGLLQLAVGYILTKEVFAVNFRVVASVLTGLGSIAYAGGHVAIFLLAFGESFVFIGSLFNLIAFALASQMEIGGSEAKQIRILLYVLSMGMALDLVSGLVMLYPDIFQPEWLGGQSGVRLRMLRLARVAAIALPVLTLLFFDLTYRLKIKTRLAKWGNWCLIGGAVLMPLTLAVSCFTLISLKYFLVVPATAVCLGTWVGCHIVFRHGSLLERFGWIVIALSLLMGMLMGMYAFDGPLPVPSGIDNYQDLTRRLMRMGHATAIMYGMLALFFAERRLLRTTWSRINQCGMWIFCGGVVAAISLMTAFAIFEIAVWCLAIGPAMICVGMILIELGGPSRIPATDNAQL